MKAFGVVVVLFSEILQGCGTLISVDMKEDILVQSWLLRSKKICIYGMVAGEHIKFSFSVAFHANLKGKV